MKKLMKVFVFNLAIIFIEVIVLTPIVMFLV